jgi:hypothetical protein
MRSSALAHTTNLPSIEQRVASLDWRAIEGGLDAFGSASTARLLSPEKCGAVAGHFAVNHRPVRGTRGNYRVTMRHGVSRIRSGQRVTLGIIFHDAK